MALQFCFGIHSTALAGVDNEELLKRLNALTTTIEKQQKDIETLKNALQKQQAGETRAKEIRETAKIEQDFALGFCLTHKNRLNMIFA
jgi:Skp family chaperone for outer membrane proteins